jgi:hypothetical protein
MATAVVSILSPVSEEAEHRKKEAQQHWKAIQQSGPLVSTNSLRIGYHAAALKRGNLWGILGFENEKQAQESSGTKQATWYNVMRIAEAFPNVEEKIYIAMKLTNAEALMDLPESKRLTEYWMRRAATDSTDTFKAVIDEEMNGKEKPSNGREKIVSFSVKMPRSRKKVVDAGLLEISKEFGCEGDESRTLELLVAEKTGTPSLITVITTAVQRCKKIKELIESELSSEEILSQVVILNEESILELAASLQNLESKE